MTEHNASTTQVASTRKSPDISKAVLGPLTVRDITVLAAVLVIFVASLLPLAIGSGLIANLWSLSGLFFIGIGMLLPLAVGVLFAVRRLSPALKPRFGSLSADQFASVVAAFATAYFFIGTVTNFHIPYLVGLIGALVLLSTTVLAQWIPIFAADFGGRADASAHVVARDAAPAAARPAKPKPALALPAGPGASGRQPGQAGYGQPGQAGPYASAQAQPGQPGVSQPVQGQQSHGWNAGAQASAAAPVGAIFTPATEATTTRGAAAAGAATQSGSPSHAEPATQAQPAVPAEASSPVQHATQAQPAAPSGAALHAEPSTQAGAASPNASAAAASSGTGASSGVVPGTAQAASEAPATMLNPKVVAGGAETGAPAAAESIGATVDPKAAVASTPFWFAVDRPQNVVDEHTRQFVFKLAPGSWILALEDRGSSFLVQDSHGKTGVLLDLVGIERAPEGN